MIYFNAKSDLSFMNQFQKSVIDFFNIQEGIKETFKPSIQIMGKDYFDAVLRATTENPEGKVIRDNLAKDIPKAIQIAYSNNVSIDLQSYPAPAVGGPIIPVNIFDAILHDTGHESMNQNWIEDCINETIGKLEQRLKKELFNLLNPLYWLYSLFVFLLRLPFLLISLTGFNMEKVEDQLIGKLFKLIELIIVLYFLLKFGIEKSDIIEIIKGLYN